MTFTKYEIRAGAYYDSVILMQLQKGLAGLPGVEDAGVVMATPANREVLLSTGFVLDDIQASADDLLIIVKGESETAVSDAIAQVDSLLKKRQSGGTGAYRPKSLKSAVSLQPDANWVLVSVPGRYAADVSHEALDLGKNVFLYSDNVSIEQEAELKQKAQKLGLLVMGPDCGTAVINNIGLGFANRVQQGNIGIVGASGTGMQAIMSEIHQLGGGISQAIGTGGRDLKDSVGGITFEQGLTALGNDDNTDVIVMISKPPSPEIANRLLATAQSICKKTVVYFLGDSLPASRQISYLNFTSSMSEAAKTAVQLSNAPKNSLPEKRPTTSPSLGYLRALFSGGTLAFELLATLQKVVYPLYTNIPFRPEQKLTDVIQSEGHTILDLGEDAFTQGRLHPMMDNDLRMRRFKQEMADPAVQMLIIDVVLGEGAHLDPASELAPLVKTAVSDHNKDVVVLIVGTDDDPQNKQAQIEQFQAAGAEAIDNVREFVAYVATEFAARHVSDMPSASLGTETIAINVGVETFYDSVTSQGGTAVQVDWRPPAGGNEKMMAILAKMKSKK
ncbi:MAG: acyl-CoA synthetase FdrA [Chloroflexota bacterium]